MTNPFTHDPFYRRIKDGLIVVFAFYTLWPSAKSAVFGKEPEKESEFVSIQILKVSLDNVNTRLTRLEDKIDRMAFYQRRNQHGREMGD